MTPYTLEAVREMKDRLRSEPPIIVRISMGWGENFFCSVCRKHGIELKPDVKPEAPTIAQQPPPKPVADDLTRKGRRGDSSLIHRAQVSFSITSAVMNRLNRFAMARKLSRSRAIGIIVDEAIADGRLAGIALAPHAQRYEGKNIVAACITDAAMDALSKESRNRGGMVSPGQLAKAVVVQVMNRSWWRETQTITA